MWGDSTEKSIFSILCLIWTSYYEVSIFSVLKDLKSSLALDNLSKSIWLKTSKSVIWDHSSSDWECLGQRFGHHGLELDFDSSDDHKSNSSLKFVITNNYENEYPSAGWISSDWNLKSLKFEVR